MSKRLVPLSLPDLTTIHKRLLAVEAEILSIANALADSEGAKCVDRALLAIRYVGRLRLSLPDMPR